MYNNQLENLDLNKNVKNIESEGLKPLQTSNWKKSTDAGRYNKEGGVFAFEHPEDAFKWAFNQQFEFKKDVSIIKIKRGKSWEVDPSEDITLTMGKGKALRSMSAINSNDVVKSFKFNDFKTPSELNISQGDWIKGIVSSLEKN